MANKKQRRSYMDKGDSMPVQFGAPSQFNGSVGNTVNLGSNMGGGMGLANNLAGKAVSPMPNIPKGAIFGS